MTVRMDSYYCRFIKRILDIVCALVLILVFCWLYVIIAVFVRVKLGSPVIFKQKRPGRINKKTNQEKIFTLYKFRTMTDEHDDHGNLLPDEVRLTRFGEWLRKTSLDELPEAINILKGDMSVIGPRPQLVRDMVFMTNEQRKRHIIRPGLSGWAQVNGRNCIEWEDKLKYDIDYINKMSFAFDVYIILITVKKVFKTENITYEDMATAEDFGDYLLRNGQICEEYYYSKQIEATKLLKVI